MTSGYVEAGYSLVGVTLAAYALRVALRSRALHPATHPAPLHPAPPAQPGTDVEATLPESPEAAS